MPVYDYKCRECEDIWQEIHSFKENHEDLGLKCPKCKSLNIFKYLGAKPVPVHFKGTGFAINDLALSKIGFPEHYKQNKEVRDKLKEM